MMRRNEGKFRLPVLALVKHESWRGAKFRQQRCNEKVNVEYKLGFETTYRKQPSRRGISGVKKLLDVDSIVLVGQIINYVFPTPKKPSLNTILPVFAV